MDLAREIDLINKTRLRTETPVFSIFKALTFSPRKKLSSVLLYETEIETLLPIDAKENTTNAYLLITLLAMLRDKGEVSKFSRVSLPSRMWFLG